MPNIVPSFTLNQDYSEQLRLNRQFRSYVPIKVSNRRFEDIEVDTLNEVFILRDKSQRDVVSTLVLQKTENLGSRYFEIKYAHSKFIQRNFMSYLFDLILIDFGYIILSDSIQTVPGSVDFWISLSRKRTKYKISVLNIKTKEKRSFKKYPKKRIWGMELAGNDEATKRYILEMMYSENHISEPTYTFIQDKMNTIADRSHIRLVCRHT